MARLYLSLQRTVAKNNSKLGDGAHGDVQNACRLKKKQRRSRSAGWWLKNATNRSEEGAHHVLWISRVYMAQNNGWNSYSYDSPPALAGWLGFNCEARLRIDTIKVVCQLAVRWKYDQNKIKRHRRLWAARTR